MRVTFVTSNPHKYREVREILAPFGIEAVRHSLALPEPQARSLRSVVREKIAHVPRRLDPVLVEDSGIFVSALEGFPGVYSRYAFETIGLTGILRMLRGRPREATFRTAAGLRENGRLWLTEGASHGTIALRPRGSRGFGYDPIFVPEGGRRTYAEMTSEEKSESSHRARAVRSVGRHLAKRMKRRSAAVA